MPDGGSPTAPTAAGLAISNVPVAAPEETVANVVERIRAGAFASVSDIVVSDNGIVVGLVRLEQVLAASEAQPVADLVNGAPSVVSPEASLAAAAHRIAGHGGRSLVVVGDDGTFCGLIPPESIISLLSAEHDEDLARLGGYLRGAGRARSAAEEPLGRRLWHRLPWLLVGLVGAMTATALVGAFEDKLSANVLIAFFVPAIVYMADAVGTQTETVLIRGLSAGVRPGAVLAREIATGMITGAVIGGAFFAFAAAGWGDSSVAAAVAIALFASCSLATLIAIALPATFQRLGIDPAFGSGPLATVIQDLLSIAVYFGVVTAIAL
jgi:magnesium transporter